MDRSDLHRQDLSPKKTRLGVVGAGAWGRVFIRAIQRTPGVVLAAIASRRIESAALGGPACRLHASWQELLADEALDGVVIVTPPSTHVAIARAAMARGLPVLIEKPLSLSVEEAETLCADARRHRALAQVDHIDLFSPRWRTVRRHLPSIGEVRSLEAVWANSGPLRQDTPARWDYGAHAIAATIALVGAPPGDVRGAFASRDGLREMFEAKLDWQQGTTATLLYGNAATEKQRRLVVRGTRGTLVYDDVRGLANLDGQPLPHSRQEPLIAAIVRFAAAIRCRRSDVADLELGTDVVRTLARLDRAAGAAA